MALKMKSHVWQYLDAQSCIRSKKKKSCGNFYTHVGTSGQSDMQLMGQRRDNTFLILHQNCSLKGLNYNGHKSGSLGYQVCRLSPVYMRSTCSTLQLFPGTFHFTPDATLKWKIHGIVFIHWFSNYNVQIYVLTVILV